MWDAVLILVLVAAVVVAGLLLLQRLEFRSVFPRRRGIEPPHRPPGDGPG